jgi:peptidase M28-like protein
MDSKGQTLCRRVAVAAMMLGAAEVDASVADGAYAHMARFQSIADSHGGDRAATTEGYEASAVYVEETLREAGYNVRRQYFPWKTPLFEKNLVQVIGHEFPLRSLPLVGSNVPKAPEGGITGQIRVPLNDGCFATDWENQLPGMVALFAVSATCNLTTQLHTAKAQGAAAALVFIESDVDGLLMAHVGDAEDMIVGASIYESAARALIDAAAIGRVDVLVDIAVGWEQSESFNVIADLGVGRPGAEATFMAGAHLDSVPGGAGINDNASGAAVLLEAALTLAGKPIRTPVRFAWWGAEETGLVGSMFYVKDLQENNPDELAGLSGYLNLDMIASPNYIIGMHGTPDSPIRTALENALAKVGTAWVEAGGNGGSDFIGFEMAGVPYAGLSSGASGLKTAEEADLFGGIAGAAYDPNYHSPNDRLININYSALRINAEAAYLTIKTMTGSTY